MYMGTVEEKMPMTMPVNTRPVAIWGKPPGEAHPGEVAVTAQAHM